MYRYMFIYIICICMYVCMYIYIYIYIWYASPSRAWSAIGGRSIKPGSTQASPPSGDKKDTPPFKPHPAVSAPASWVPSSIGPSPPGKHTFENFTI